MANDNFFPGTETRQIFDPKILLDQLADAVIFICEKDPFSSGASYRRWRLL
jgi:hypothetical protein